AEGRLDALLSDIACFKRLSSSEAVILGLYRQGYQTLRECLIGKPNRAVPYDHNTVEYRFFNQVSAVTSRLVLQARKEPDDELAWSTVRRIYSVRSSDWISAVQQSGNG